MALSRRNFLKAAGLGATLAAGAATSAAASSGDPLPVGQQPSMLYDTTLCVGCRACQNGCRQWNETAPERSTDRLYDAPTDLSGRTWTVIQLYADKEVENPTTSRDNWSFIKRNCMHCIDPACVSACTVGALEKSPAGPVTYNLDKCFGCRYCMIACPYHVPRYQWWTTVPLVQKCTFCYGYAGRDAGEDARHHPKNRLEQGMGPRCVESCPTGALTWGTRDEMLAQAKARIAAAPGKYYEDRVYGEHEAGGTLQLILSHVPFEAVGLPKLDPKPIPAETRPANVAVPWLVLGVGSLATVIYNVRGKQEAEHPSTAGQDAQGKGESS